MASSTISLILARFASTQRGCRGEPSFFFASSVTRTITCRYYPRCEAPVVFCKGCADVSAESDCVVGFNEGHHQSNSRCGRLGTLGNARSVFVPGCAHGNTGLGLPPRSLSLNGKERRTVHPSLIGNCPPQLLASTFCARAPGAVATLPSCFPLPSGTTFIIGVFNMAVNASFVSPTADATAAHMAASFDANGLVSMLMTNLSGWRLVLTIVVLAVAYDQCMFQSDRDAGPR
jgi:hypothetical protein